MTEHQCHHRHGDGRLCGSPRLPNKNFCYHHTRLHESYILPGTRYYNPPPLTDFHNIQLALTHVWSALSKGLITHKLACSMIYNIQLAKQTIKDIMKCGTDSLVGEKCGTDSPVGERGEAAPAFTAEELLAMENDLSQSFMTDHAAVTGDTAGSAVILSEDARPSEGPLNSSPSTERSGPSYDKSNPPLCLEPVLRPLFSRAPDPSSPATWIPISDAEYIRMDNYRHLGPSDPTPDIIQRRRELHCRFIDKTPTPDQIAKALLELEQEQARSVKEREDVIRMIRAKKRDERNRELLGF